MEKYDESSILKINSNNSIQSNINIIKELIDNSLDVKSTKIILEFYDSATSKIICIDNGTGITKKISSNQLGQEAHQQKLIKSRKYLI